MAPGFQPVASDFNMSLIDLNETAMPECQICETCGQLRQEGKAKNDLRISEMINFYEDTTFSRSDLKDFDEFFKATIENQSLVQIFDETEREVINNDEPSKEDLLSGTISDLIAECMPNDLPIPLVPRVVIRPVLDLLTGLDLDVTLPETETLKPGKYVPQPAVGILIVIDDVEDERKPLPQNEAEEILRFLCPELYVSEPSPSPTEELEPIKNEVPEVPEPVEPQSRRKSRKRNRRSRKSGLVQVIERAKSAEETKVSEPIVEVTVQPEEKIITPPAAEVTEAISEEKIITPPPAEEAKVDEVIAEEKTITPPSVEVAKVAEPTVEIFIHPKENIIIPVPESPPSSPEADRLFEATMMPKRRDLTKAGKIGIRTQIYVNMLAIELSDNLPSEIEQYYVNFEPNKPRELTYKAYEIVKSHFFPDHHPAYNGDTQILSPGCLPIESPLIVTVDVKENYNSVKEMKVKVTITKAVSRRKHVIDLNWMKNALENMAKTKQNYADLGALQLIMNSVAVKNGIRANGSYFVPPEDGLIKLGGDMEMWYGLFQSVTLGWKPFLKVDVIHKGFYWDVTLIDYVKSLISLKSNVLTFDDMKANWSLINERLRNLSVTVTCNSEKRHHQIINELVDIRSTELVSENANGEKMSVWDYFLNEKNYEIQYPDLACLMTENCGTKFYVPMELCTIEGDQPWKNMSGKQQQTLHEASVTNADIRRRKITYAFNTVNKKDDACLKSFGVSVNREFEEITARVLEPPTLYFQNNKSVEPDKGTWVVEGFNQTTDRLIPNFSWTILNFSTVSKETINVFATTFQLEAIKLGLILGLPFDPFVNVSHLTSEQTAATFKYLKDNNVQLIIAVIPDRSRHLYCTIKQLADIHIGIVTQCIKVHTIDILTDEIIRNIMMKINAKMCGINYSVFLGTKRPACLRDDCMIVGADVTHPGTKAAPSIAALVATFDPSTHFQYNVELRFQPPNVELMDDLQSMMRQQLINYYTRSNKRKPMRIFYYRDGVGEGDFVRVMNTELLAIKRACFSLEESYNPAITFVIVQKRIHTRFFPLEGEEADKFYNVKVGTVVDTVVTHPTDIDFILVSHPTAQGTTNPTKYRCLWDDSNLSEDDLEELTYYLCHMFARCSKSVKYPAPTYYAHLACSRARSLTHGMYIDLNNLPNEQWKLKVHEDIEKFSPMYFL